ncbi:ABC transporter substrate-binding protein [uncultured Boseongicola sp.]|jgi:putative spermidine/putrescine transport system substrate-binding protein|uniref:ABC transporter substrate-binding protein n=1 Tax=uncultured Boseongicola sp. TaxID=1648499 RepID=UPI002621C380|nr:ABC transporter substrate-binding protein [uncultured Boseongicola sp.]
MKKILILTTALSGVALAANAASHSTEVTVIGWGGAYTNSQVEAYHKPFTEATGITVNSADADNPATPIKAQVEAGNVTIDVASVEIADAVRLCDEGLIEEIDASTMPDGADGTPAVDDFIAGTLTDCMIPTDVFATAIAYDTTKFTDGAPTSIADFYDLEKFPGKRGLKKGAKTTLEMALMADGVLAGDVYATLETDEGVDRAFAKLDTIKDSVVWWEAGSQPVQLLADGEVLMTMGWNGRIFSAAVGEGQPFAIMWDGQVFEWEGWVIPKGAPNKEGALEFIKFSTGTAPLAAAAEWISYGPPRKSSAPLVGVYKGDGTTQMGPQLPTSPENQTNALASSLEFWADRDSELNERFNAWLAQ